MLKEINIFSCLDQEILADLQRAAVRRRFQENTVLFNKGDASDSMYVITEGKVKAVLYNEDGKEILLSIFGPGDYFGEIGMMDGQPRTASAVSKTPCQLLILKKEDLDRIIFYNAEISAKLLKQMLIKLREATVRIENLTFLNLYGRVINLLLQLADQKDGEKFFTEKLTHQEIANRVGASREMVSKIMKELTCGGYLEVSQHRIMIRKKLLATY